MFANNAQCIVGTPIAMSTWRSSYAVSQLALSAMDLPGSAIYFCCIKN